MALITPKKMPFMFRGFPLLREIDTSPRCPADGAIAHMHIAAHDNRGRMCLFEAGLGDLRDSLTLPTELLLHEYAHLLATTGGWSDPREPRRPAHGTRWESEMRNLMLQWGMRPPTVLKAFEWEE